jgi:hypothetical protein
MRLLTSYGGPRILTTQRMFSCDTLLQILESRWIGILKQLSAHMESTMMYRSGQFTQEILVTLIMLVMMTTISISGLWVLELTVDNVYMYLFTLSDESNFTKQVCL